MRIKPDMRFMLSRRTFLARELKRAIILLLALLLLGCQSTIQTDLFGTAKGKEGAGQGDGSTDLDDMGLPFFEDNGEFFVELSDGTMVGKFFVQQPPADVSTFITRVTMPVPRNPHHEDVSFAIEDYDGNLVPANLHPVSWHSDMNDGPNVVELIAQVTRNPDIATGMVAKYNIIFTRFEGPPQPPTQSSVKSYLSSLPGLKGSIISLLEAGKIRVKMRDINGQQYGTNILEPVTGLNGSELGMGYGPFAGKHRRYSVMTKIGNTDSVTGCADLIHGLGVHSYTTAFANEDFMLIDLRLSNGFSNTNSNTTLDNPLGDIFLKDVTLEIPPGYSLIQDVDDPTFDNNTGETVSDGYQVVDLTKERSDGKFIYLRREYKTFRRLAIAKEGFESRAKAYLNAMGRGFIRSGTNDEGMQLLSWDNPLTAHYFPTNLPIPNVNYINRGDVLQFVNNRLSNLKNILQTGEAGDAYTFPRMDLIHPKWGAYGGFAGGDSIGFSFGVSDMVGLEPSYNYTDLTYRTIQDRHSNALYNLRGNQTSSEDWIYQCSQLNDYPQTDACIPFEYSNGRVTSWHDPFGYNNVDTCQYDWTIEHNKQPPYKEDLDAIQDIDAQHYVRNTALGKVLIWLGNDMVAKDDMITSAEIADLNFYRYLNVNHHGVKGLLGDLVHAMDYPGQTSSTGRAAGWSVDAMVAAYRVADSNWRETKKPWFDMWVDMFALAQVNCGPEVDGGFLFSVINNAHIFEGSPGGNNYLEMQPWEQHIVDNGLRGIGASVMKYVDETRFNKVREIIRKTNNMQISDLVFGVHQAPTAHMAISQEEEFGPFDAICTLEEFPSDLNYVEPETYYASHGFGVAYFETGDTVYLEKATTMWGASSLNQLENMIKAQGREFIFNNAVLLSAVQYALGGAALP